ncbi:unnamed protein product [Prunus brigantina]
MLDYLKKRLEGAEEGKVEASNKTGETPFSLAYETEAIILPHIIVHYVSIEVGSLDQSCKQMKVNLDLLEEE